MPTMSRSPEDCERLGDIVPGAANGNNGTAGGNRNAPANANDGSAKQQPEKKRSVRIFSRPGIPSSFPRSNRSGNQNEKGSHKLSKGEEADRRRISASYTIGEFAREMTPKERRCWTLVCVLATVWTIIVVFLLFGTAFGVEMFAEKVSEEIHKSEEPGAGNGTGVTGTGLRMLRGLLRGSGLGSGSGSASASASVGEE